MGARNARLTIYEVKKRLFDKDPTIELLSTSYVNSKSKLRLRCKKHGYEWEASFNNLMKPRHKCQICSGKKINFNIALKNIKKWHSNIQVLTDYYINVNQKFHLKCKKCGHEWHCAYKHIEHSSGCCECSYKKQGEKKRKSFKEVKDSITKKTNGMLKVIDENFKGVYKPLLVECTDCGHVYYDTYHKIKGRNIGCLRCDKTTLNVAEAERKKESWSNKVGYLYIINCYSEKESFYKIGITRHSVKNRYSYNNMPYDYNIIELYEDNLYDITHLENDLLRLGRKRNLDITPSTSFAGHTECFSEEILGIFNKIINERRILNGS